MMMEYERPSAALTHEGEEGPRDAAAGGKGEARGCHNGWVGGCAPASAAMEANESPMMMA